MLHVIILDGIERFGAGNKFLRFKEMIILDGIESTVHYQFLWFWSEEDNP